MAYKRTLMFKTFTTHLADSQPGLSVSIEKQAEYLRDCKLTTNPGDVVLRLRKMLPRNLRHPPFRYKDLIAYHQESSERVLTCKMKKSIPLEGTLRKIKPC